MGITTEIYHLQELARYEDEKPYTMRYVPDGQVAVSNVAREKHVVDVRDMRQQDVQLDHNGFTFLSLPQKMSYTDFDSHENITTTYLPELETVLRQQFPDSTVDFVSYLVSCLTFGLAIAC